MSAEHIVSVPYSGVDFTVAASEHYRIAEVKLQGKWWPARDVLSPTLLAQLQTALDAMPLNTTEDA